MDSSDRPFPPSSPPQSSASVASQLSLGAPGDARSSGERWGLLALLLALIAIAWFFFSLTRDIDAASFTRLDLKAVQVDSGPGWVDARWSAWIEQRLEELAPLDADGEATSQTLRAALEDLPFVAEVGAVRVLWPDAVRVDLRWREPVGCLRAGDAFALVSAEGVVLPGEWSAPPPRRFGYFPVLAGSAVAREEIQSGAWLEDPVWEDGLSVARALARELGADDWVRVGRMVVDAREARQASTEHPGVVLWLEGGRRAYFGRAPNSGEPGELPVERKCAALSRALRLLDDGPAHLDWELVDLRWDRPELLPRGGLPEAPEKRRAEAGRGR